MSEMSIASPRCLAIILAAGEGTRMKSATPKVLHTIAGRSLLAHVLDAVKASGAASVAVVVGPGRDDVSSEAVRAVPELLLDFRDELTTIAKTDRNADVRQMAHKALDAS